MSAPPFFQLGSSEASLRLSAAKETREAFWSSVKQLWGEGAFCDALLFPGEEGSECLEMGIPCHSLVLASLSATLLSALSDDPEPDGPRSIFLPDHNRESVEGFVRTIYSHLAGEEGQEELPENQNEVAKAMGVQWGAIHARAIKEEVDVVLYEEEEDEEEEEEDDEEEEAWREPWMEDEETKAVVLKSLKRKRKALKQEEDEGGGSTPSQKSRRGRRKKASDQEAAAKVNLCPLPPADDVYAQMVSGQGTMEVDLKEEALDNAWLAKQVTSRSVRFLSLVGLRSSSKTEEEKGRPTSVEALPLAWTPLEDGMQAEGDRFSQYMNYCR